MASYKHNFTTQGISTYTLIVPVTGQLEIAGTLRLPGIQEGDSSQSVVQVIIQKNSSTVYTGLVGAKGFKASVNCAASDTITIATSSAAAIDNALNAFTMTVSIYEGAV